MSENEEMIFESEEEALEDCWDHMLTYDFEVHSMIGSIRAGWQNKSKNDPSHSVGFYKAFLDLLDRFEKKVADSILFDAPDHWGYTIDIDTNGIELLLQCIESCSLEEDGTPCYMIDESYHLIKVEAKQLTVEEYAAQYDVEVVTVRQWIRRGKLRTAHKEGKTWKISELTELPGRGYEPAYYSWREYLDDLPEAFQFFNNYNHVTIKQDESIKDKFIVTFRDKAGNHEERNLSAKEKEKLEVFLLSHPQIRCSSTRIASYG